MSLTSIQCAALLEVAAATAACGRTAGSSQTASNYPPNYMYGSQCTGDASFTVCRMGNASQVALTVEYRGALAGHAGLQYFVHLNGRTGTYAPREGAGYLFLTNGYTDCRSASGGGSSWDCTDAPDSMKQLFFWSRDQHGNVNDWDIEVAVVDGAGNWDSRFGANYPYRIDRTTPYRG